jgi:hypothetical protein
MKWKTKQLNTVYKFFAVVPHYCIVCKSGFWWERGFYKYCFSPGMLGNGIFEVTCQDCGTEYFDAN